MSNYQDDLKIATTKRLRERLAELPPFVSEFMRGISENTSALTRIGYAYDLKIFLTFLSHEIPEMDGKPIIDMDLDDIKKVTPENLEEFMEYLTYYTKTEDDMVFEYQNEERGKSRKFAALRTMYSYFYKKRRLPSNPSDLVDFPKLHQKNITRLETNEIADLLDEVESGEHLTEHQKHYHDKTTKRDLAITTLLLGTGLRVSECIGINISDVDFDLNGVKITRKGGNESIIYFGDEVREALLDYIEQRKNQGTYGKDEPLFLSLQNKRITVRAVQKLVAKYTKPVTPLKKISPHKLRSTYGTQLYRETGDIYMVADVLGHADVNTTRKHYAEMDDMRRRKAATYVKLR